MVSNGFCSSQSPDDAQPACASEPQPPGCRTGMPPHSCKVSKPRALPPCHCPSQQLTCSHSLRVFTALVHGSLSLICRESAEALSAAIEREAELRAALADATARLQAAAAGGQGMCCPCKAAAWLEVLWLQGRPLPCWCAPVAACCMALLRGMPVSH